MEKIKEIIAVMALIWLFPINAMAGSNDSLNEGMKGLESAMDGIKSSLFQLDQQQILARTAWVNEGVEIFKREIKELEEKIDGEKKRIAIRTDASIKGAWNTWEIENKSLLAMESKRAKLDEILLRLENLQRRLKNRLLELEGIPEPRLINFAIAVGDRIELDSTKPFNGDSNAFIGEIRFRFDEIGDVFVSIDGKSPETTLLGGELALLKTRQKVKDGILIERFPFGMGFIPDKTQVVLLGGAMAEIVWKSFDNKQLTNFFEVRGQYNFGSNWKITISTGMFIF